MTSPSPTPRSRRTKGSQRASIEDVARLAKVSSGTVSRALRGLPNVSEKTRAKVAAAAEQLQYVASPSASSLASGRMSTVGVVTPYISRWFFAEVLSGIDQVLQDSSFDLVLYMDTDGELFEKLPMRRRVDAVLLLTLPSDVPDVEGVATLGVPVGSLGVDIPGFSSVTIDDVAGAETAVNHLIGLGHRAIAMVTLDREFSINFRPPYLRSAGYHKALAAAGIEARPEFEVDGHSTIEGGEQAAASCSAAPIGPPPSSCSPTRWQWESFTPFAGPACVAPKTSPSLASTTTNWPASSTSPPWPSRQCAKVNSWPARYSTRSCTAPHRRRRSYLLSW